MNIRASLLADRSKENIMKIAAYIGEDQERFDQLVQLFLKDTIQVTQRSAWIINHCFDQHPQLVQPHLETFWKNLLQPQNNAIKRNTLRIFQDYPIPKKLQGIAASLCFDYLADPNEAIAVRVFSMSVLFNIGQSEPDLLPELAILIEEILPHGSMGLRSRGNKILKAIRQMPPTKGNT